MLAQQRQDRVLTALRHRGAVTVAELAGSLGVSDMTVRRDLEQLARAGRLRKVHGGAVALGQTAFEPGFAAKSELARDAKLAITAHAATLIRPGATIGLTAGTTTWALARHVAALPGITVVTNSTMVADTITSLDAAQAISVILTGGVRTPSAALVGPVADRAIAGLHVDQLFLGVHGLDARAGFTTPNVAEAATNRVFVESAREVVVLADSSKLGVIGLAEIGPLSVADVLITDDRLAAVDRRALSEQIESVMAVAVPS